MINPFIKLTGSDGYGNEKSLFLNVNQISGYSIESRRNITRVASDAEIFYATETPEEIAAMIQKYYDEKMRLAFIRSVLTGICSNPNFHNWDFHVWEFVSNNTVYLTDMMMKKMKNV